MLMCVHAYEEQNVLSTLSVTTLSIYLVATIKLIKWSGRYYS